MLRSIVGYLLIASSLHAVDLKETAHHWKTSLANTVLPFWHDTTLDRTHGGYVLAFDAILGPLPPSEKQLVGSTRLIWTFAHAHQAGLSNSSRNYLDAASHGLEFLRQHFKDSENGGYYFTCHPDGTPRNTNKIIYGQAFVIYALIEYARASGDQSAVDEAMEMYRLIQAKALDTKNGGWNEHFSREWIPLSLGDSSGIVEVVGLKSANTHLHLMEAFTELYLETGDEMVRKSLVESLEINQRHFYPIRPGDSAFHRNPDWSEVTEPRSQGLSYGHNVEFAWLMIRAEQALKRPPSWGQFHAHIKHALRWGTDHQLGGVYALGNRNQPANDTRKIWWVQSEMLAALADGLGNRPRDVQYQDALIKLVGFIERHQTDPNTGIWLDTVTAEGHPISTGIAHSWKANYHDVRAILKFTNAFAP